jgi:hypothetical protein
MTSDEATIAVLDVLNALGVPYLVVGSLASNYYGVPRATQDADIVVHAEKTSIAEIAERLGSRFRWDRQASFEMVTATTRHVVNVVGSPFYIEFFLLSEDAHDQERFRRRRRVRMLEREVFVPTVEDMIVTKLRWSQAGKRAKDVDDVRNMIAVQRDRIHWEYVVSWCDRHGTRGLLEELRRSTLA